MKPITSIDELLEELQEEESIDFFVMVSPIIKSSKSIFYDKYKKVLYVTHEISETEELINFKNLEDSCIQHYINEGKLYRY
jgi:hypothetical protein